MTIWGRNGRDDGNEIMNHNENARHTNARRILQAFHVKTNDQMIPQSVMTARLRKRANRTRHLLLSRQRIELAITGKHEYTSIWETAQMMHGKHIRS